MVTSGVFVGPSHKVQRCGRTFFVFFFGGGGPTVRPHPAPPASCRQGDLVGRLLCSGYVSVTVSGHSPSLAKVLKRGRGTSGVCTLSLRNARTDMVLRVCTMVPGTSGPEFYCADQSHQTRQYDGTGGAACGTSGGEGVRGAGGRGGAREV